MLVSALNVKLLQHSMHYGIKQCVYLLQVNNTNAVCARVFNLIHNCFSPLKILHLFLCQYTCSSSGWNLIKCNNAMCKLSFNVIRVNKRSVSGDYTKVFCLWEANYIQDLSFQSRPLSVTHWNILSGKL